MTNATIQWIKWWEGTFDEETRITKQSVQKDGEVTSFYIIMPMLETLEGRMALTCLSVNDVKFARPEAEIVAYLSAKREEFERTLSYGETTPRETSVSVVTGLSRLRYLKLP